MITEKFRVFLGRFKLKYYIFILGFRTPKLGDLPAGSMDYDLIAGTNYKILYFFVSGVDFEFRHLLYFYVQDIGIY
jgi:hypothetical protein